MLRTSNSGDLFSCKEKQTLRRMQLLEIMNMEIASNFEAQILGS